MGCCGDGHNQNGNNDDNSNCHGGRGFSCIYIILIVGIVMLVLKAAL